MASRDRFVVHRVNEQELQDLARLAARRGETRSRTMRALVAEETGRVEERARQDKEDYS